METLLAMGYRPMPTRPSLHGATYGKPVGYHLLTVYVEGSSYTFTNYFRTAQGEVAVWERQVCNTPVETHGSLVKWLKYVECFTRLDMAVKQDSKFEFLTAEQAYNL